MASESSLRGTVAFDPAQALAESRHYFGEHGGVNKSIEASTTFTVMHAEDLPAIFAGRPDMAITPDGDRGGFLYSRHYNPTVYGLGHEIAALEGAEAGYPMASGMAAISCTLMQLCDSGDRIVSSDTVYGGTHALMQDMLPQKANIHTTFVDITDLDAVRAAMAAGEGKVKVLYTETLSNPTLKVANLPALSKIAHEHGAKLVVDNTFIPCVVSPIKHGADIVLYSMTKYINGASDIVAGVVCGRRSFIQRLMDLHTGALMLFGAVMDPRIAFEISMRLPHLPIRIQEHGRRALFLAQRVEAKGVRVRYPGLPSHPQHELFKSMANKDYGFGGMIALDMGTLDKANALMEYLQNHHRFGYIAVSLGYADTLMSASGATTSSEVPEEERLKAGISPGLIRMSVGFTGGIEDRWAQLEDGLDYVAKAE